MIAAGNLTLGLLGGVAKGGVVERSDFPRANGLSSSGTFRLVVE